MRAQPLIRSRPGRSPLAARVGDELLQDGRQRDLDRVGAGVGERVLVDDEGNGARGVLGSLDGPVRSVVVAIVDAVELTAPPRAG